MSADAVRMRLEVIAGNAAGTTITVEDALVIGRHADGAGRLSEDQEISRQHARISRERSGDYAIEDLGSSNGTFVNGLRIQSPRLLAPGDSIETGATTLVVREIERPEPAQPPPTEAPQASAPAGLSAPTVFARVPDLAPVAPATAETAAPGGAQAGDSGAPTEPSATAEPSAPAEPVPLLALSLEVDFEAREARIALGENGETVRMVLVDGVWRTAG